MGGDMTEEELLARYSRNKELLDSFTAYCKTHPSERFWQALRNWSGFHFVGVAQVGGFPEDPEYVDTFNWEGRDG